MLGSGAGHSAAALAITSSNPIIVTMLAQSRCIGSKSSAHAVEHAVGMPPGHVASRLSASQHAAVTACVRAMNSGPVHDDDIAALGDGLGAGVSSV